ncbi:hypothetical protein LXA43DRAFT_860782, partial [Ganoderma leucocontextum]
RLRLPNGQVAHSQWKESLKPLSWLRIVRNVKIVRKNKIDYAEVQYFLCLRVGAEIHELALVSYYSAPDETLLDLSYHAIWSCSLGGALGLINVHDIESVVTMISH